MHRKRVDDDEDDADESGEDQVDGERDEFLDVGANFLELAECLATALILEVRQLERVPDAVRIHLGAHSLDDGVDVVVLEILGDARDESHTHRHKEKSAGAFDERRSLVLTESRRVIVDDVTEDERIEQREDLVGRRQHQREQDQPAVFVEVGVEESHQRILLGCRPAGNSVVRVRRATPLRVISGRCLRRLSKVL